MKKISLISNTSIQYYKFETTIDLESNKTNKIYYNEPFDNKLQCFIYDPLCKVMIDGEEFFYRKQELIEKELIKLQKTPAFSKNGLFFYKKFQIYKLRFSFFKQIHNYEFNC